MFSNVMLLPTLLQTGWMLWLLYAAYCQERRWALSQNLSAATYWRLKLENTQRHMNVARWFWLAFVILLVVIECVRV